MLLGDSQKYLLAVQQLRALSSSRGEDDRKTQKVEGNALGMGSQNRADLWHLRPDGTPKRAQKLAAHLQLRPDQRCRTARVSEDYLARLLGSKFSCAWREHAHEHRHCGSCHLKLARRVESHSERIEPEGV
jgi:hypothetical protein